MESLFREQVPVPVWASEHSVSTYYVSGQVEPYGDGMEARGRRLSPAPNVTRLSDMVDSETPRNPRGLSAQHRAAQLEELEPDSCPFLLSSSVCPRRSGQSDEIFSFLRLQGKACTLLFI